MTAVSNCAAVFAAASPLTLTDNGTGSSTLTISTTDDSKPHSADPMEAGGALRVSAQCCWERDSSLGGSVR